jgi:hypothetical protein
MTIFPRRAGQRHDDGSAGMCVLVARRPVDFLRGAAGLATLARANRCLASNARQCGLYQACELDLPPCVGLVKGALQKCLQGIDADAKLFCRLGNSDAVDDF